MTIPPTEIELKVMPSNFNSDHRIEIGNPVDHQETSFWASGNDPNEGRSPIAQAVMEHRAAEIERKLKKVTPSATELLIRGSKIIMVDRPVRNPGIAIFADLEFLLSGPEFDLITSSVQAAEAAAMSVPLDNCLVWVISSSDTSGQNPQPGMHQSDGEHIEWPIDQVTKLGLSGINDKHGVKIQGSKPAGDYLRLLRQFHYWCPKFVGTQNATDLQDSAYAVVFGLVCTMEAGHSTSKFSVKLVIESPENAMEDLASNEAIQRLSPSDDDDSDYVNDAPESNEPNLSDLANHAMSNQERRSQDEPSLRLLGPDQRGSNSNDKIYGVTAGSGAAIAGIVLSVLAILIVGSLVLIAFIRRDSNKPVSHDRHDKRNNRQRRFPRQPADFGGANLKQDLTLRMTENPMEDLQKQYSFVPQQDDLYGSSGDLESEQYLFSPPTSRLGSNQLDGLHTAAHLASLDEFEEEEEEDFDDYLDQTDVEVDEPEVMHHIAQVHAVAPYSDIQSSDDLVEAISSKSVHDEEEVGFEHPVKKWNLVAQTELSNTDGPVSNV